MAREWLKCLLDKEYAQKTWLRITPDTEKRTLQILDIAIFALFMLALFVGGLAWGRWQSIRHQAPEYQVIIEE